MKTDPKKNLFRWGPIEGRPIFPDYWYAGMMNFYKDYNPGWSEILGFFEGDKFLIIIDRERLHSNGEKVFKRYILNDGEFKKNLRIWEKTLLSLKKYLDLKKEDLEGLSDKKFKDLCLKWNKIYGKEFWNIGSLPEVANYGCETILPRELKKIKDEEDFHFALERLSAPEDLSFYQKEESDLLSIKKIKDKEVRRRKLEIHQQKYFWMLNSYHGTRVLPVSYFEKILSSISPAEAEKKIKEIEEMRRLAARQKMEVIKRFKLSARVYKISQRSAFCIWWQDLRKSYIFKANHVVDLFLREISERFKITFSELFYYNINELENLLINKIKINKDEIKSRQKNTFLIFSPRRGGRYYSGETARKMFLPFNIKAEKTNIKEFKGVVVNRGKVRGRAKIINSPKEIGKMKKGDILVAPMTSPDFILALKKARAVVTDEGGMTCHAAIVARELKIPGIVATRIATKILKDEDLVEVDADKGVIKILN